MRVPGILIGSIDDEVDLVAFVPVVPGKGPIDQGIHRIAQAAGVDAFLGGFLQKRNDVQFRAGKRRVRRGLKLVAFGGRELLHHLAHDELGFIDQGFEVRSGDFNVDRPPAGDRAFEQTGLRGEREHAGHFAGGIGDDGNQFPGTADPPILPP